jgi:spore germination protein GerM
MLMLAVVLVAGGIAGCKRKTAGPVPAGDAESSVTATSSSQTSTASAESTATAAGTAAETTSATNPPLPPGSTVKTMKVKLYFGYEDRVMAVTREVPYSQAVAKTAMLELLKGPSAEELKGLKLHNEIPKGTKVLSVILDGHTIKVDLSKEFDDGGGTLSMDMRLAQVVYTLTQYSTIESVEFYMEGKKVKVFGGEGIMLDGPQRPEDYYDRVPIDA